MRDTRMGSVLAQRPVRMVGQSRAGINLTYLEAHSRIRVALVLRDLPDVAARAALGDPPRRRSLRADSSFNYGYALCDLWVHPHAAVGAALSTMTSAANRRGIPVTEIARTPRLQPPGERPGLVRAAVPLALRPCSDRRIRSTILLELVRCAAGQASSCGRPLRVRLGAQLIRDLLLRAGRRRLVLLEGGDRRLPGAGVGSVGGLCRSIGHGEASPSVVLPAYAGAPPDEPRGYVTAEAVAAGGIRPADGQPLLG